MLTDAQLAELLRLEREATPGPWQVPPSGDAVVVEAPSVYETLIADCVGDERNDLAARDPEQPCRNAALIAAARNALPGLLRELATARAVVAAAIERRDARTVAAERQAETRFRAALEAAAPCPHVERFMSIPPRCVRCGKTLEVSRGV